MITANNPVAYFCAEFALESGLPTYAGGLGVLAGDYIREANDQHLPVVGVGLYYNFDNLNHREPLLNPDKSRLILTVPIADREVNFQVIQCSIGSVPVYLLDTNLEENSPSDRAITRKLYVADKEARLKQEILLGIGGQRALEALGIHPSVYHLNEGHSAFLALELIHDEMQEKKVGFDAAVQSVRKMIVFTNHTLVAAGREVYGSDLVSLALTQYAANVGVPVSQIVSLGLVQDSSAFSMTILSLRLAGKVNAVSRLHSQKAADIWTDHPMSVVTNGIHIPTWDRIRGVVSQSAHLDQKKRLLQILRDKGNVYWDEKTLLLGWARRFVEYKRPLAILEDLDRFMRITRQADRPVHIVFSGGPHEQDVPGQELLVKLRQLISSQISDVAVYLPDYNFDLAKDLVAGCDVWLNTPIVGFEACGTSGMKAALNGVLPCSTRDGWVEEIEMYKVGWTLNSDNLSKDVLDVLERDIVPMYYDRPQEWEQLMKNARDTILNQFSATRMLHEYNELFYNSS